MDSEPHFPSNLTLLFSFLFFSFPFYSQWRLYEESYLSPQNIIIPAKQVGAAGNVSIHSRDDSLPLLPHHRRHHRIGYKSLRSLVGMAPGPNDFLILVSKLAPLWYLWLRSTACKATRLSAMVCSTIQRMTERPDAGSN